MIEQRFRDNYDGEFVVVSAKWKDGKKETKKEFIENPITNQHISGRAVIIGQDETGRSDVIKILQNHRGGLLGQQRLQTYGCEGVWRKIRLDFCVENDIGALEEIINNSYTTDTVVYSSARNCLRFPGNFYIVPYGVRLQPSATAAYLAAFDGHKEIFILGVDGINRETIFDPQAEHDMVQVFKAYRDVKFYVVTDASPPPDSWRNCQNVKVWNHATFINHCDV